MLSSAVVTGTVVQESAVSAMAVAMSVLQVKTSGPSLLIHSMLEPGRQHTWP